APSAASPAQRPGMARELSQEAVLDFLWGAGGSAPNSALLRHFERFLRDPALSDAQRRQRRDRFKRLVNSVATVRAAAAPGASKDISLLLLGLRPREPPPSQSLAPPAGPYKPPPASLLPPPSGPQEPPPSQSLLPPLGPKEQPPPQSLPSLLGSGRSQSPLSPEGTRAPLTIGLPRSLPLSLAGPPPYRARPSPGTKGPPPSQCLLPPAGPEVLPCNGPSHSQSEPQQGESGTLSPAAPLRFQSQSQSLLSAPVPGVRGSLERSSPKPMPIFRSIRCQLASLEAQDIPPSGSEVAREQSLMLPPAITPRSVPGRGPTVPLGHREHAWLVAVSAGRWAHMRALFWEEPQLALWRDFMSGFTALHWLAKHGDGQGLRELAAAAREAGLALDVDARSGCGYTPLHLAAMHGHQPAVKVLVLQLGCRVRVRDSSGRQPWEYLGSSTSGEIWKLLEAP
ncbi:SWAHB protein, partial [Nothoprocta ornata]|nr:SWAHB protein [Nothoprocta ornata]